MKILFSFPVLILLLCISLTGMENAFLQKTVAESMDLINSIFSLILIGAILLKAIFSGKKKNEKETDQKDENKQESPFGALEASIVGKAKDGAEFYLVKMPQAK